MYHLSRPFAAVDIGGKFAASINFPPASMTPAMNLEL
jgi:hypothetical protein